jgi:hypothetical protein
MKFKIEQIAISVGSRASAMNLLFDIGAKDWHLDTVSAVGKVFGKDGQNTANLAFNYEICEGKEFEVLEYTSGPNWIAASDVAPCVSHFGMHCTQEELDRWIEFFDEQGIKIAQAVETVQHTNPVIAGKRWYTYVIFDTRRIIGTDLKFIVRRDRP